MTCTIIVHYCNVHFVKAGFVASSKLHLTRVQLDYACQLEEPLLCFGPVGVAACPWLLISGARRLKANGKLLYLQVFVALHDGGDRVGLSEKIDNILDLEVGKSLCENPDDLVTLSLKISMVPVNFICFNDGCWL